MAAINANASGRTEASGETKPQETLNSTASLAAEINAEYELAVGAYRKSLEHGRRLGAMLLQVQAEVGHGQYRAWIRANCVFTHRTAERYTRLVKNWTTIVEKSDTVSPLTMRGALRLVASEGKPCVDPVAGHDVHDDGVRDAGVEVQVDHDVQLPGDHDQTLTLSLLLHMWSEATHETRLDFLTRIHGRGELMPVVEASVKRSA